MLGDVEALLRLKVGDERRLDSMRARIKNGRPLYNSDRKYVESLKSGMGMSESPEESPTDVPAREDEEYGGEDDMPHAVSDDAVHDKNVIIINQHPGSSAAWYLLPVFMPIMGGVISYLCLRKQDPSRARKTLVLGAVLSVIPVVFLALVLGFVYNEVDSTRVSQTDLSDEQIKQGALAVPYESLMEDAEGYAGEIITYEGEIVQVRDSFNSYTLRISVSGSDTIWSNFDPGTDEEEQWIKTLEKELRPFGQDRDAVQVWGLFTGLRDYDTVFGYSNTVPEVDVYILERAVP